MDLATRINTLQATIGKLVAPRHVSGTYPLDQENVGLFYRNNDGDKTGWMNFASKDGVADSKLEDLVAVSEEAKFGLGNKDVLDPSYRKAWKLDASKFALQFDLVNSGILETVHDALLHYENSELVLEAHLDKMNVYGPGSFFKSHVDTPRDKNMIATLVIVLPTEHKGGDLLLMNKNWTFDSANMVSKASAETPRLAFIAFYSDIDHEVTPVESGYRITVTYNLYCTKRLSPAAPKVSLRVSPEEKMLREALRALLEDKTVLPKGGVIAFGLTYKYPIDPQGISSLDTTFSGLLKGGDALIERACRSLNLRLKVQALYMDSRYSQPVVDSRDSGNISYLTYSTTIAGPDMEDEDGDAYLREELDRSGYSVRDYTYGHNQPSKKPVLWLTPPKALLETAAPWVAYGNEATLAYIYGRLVLTAQVPAYKERNAIFDGETEVASADSESDSGDE